MVRRRVRYPSPFEMAVRTAPHSNLSKIVFKWEFGTRNWSKEDFLPMKTGNRVSNEDIDQLLNRLESLPYHAKIPMIFNKLKYLTSIFVLIMFGLGGLIHLNGTDTPTSIPLYIGIGICIFMIMGNILMSIIMTKCEYRKKRQKRMDDIWGVLNEYNQKFQSKEVSFKMGNLSALLQLDLDFMINKYSNQQQQGNQQQGYQQQGYNQGNMPMPMGQMNQMQMGGNGGGTGGGMIPMGKMQAGQYDQPTFQQNQVTPQNFY